MHYWLIKSESASYSIDHLKRDKVVAWEGVRNFQARNYMMQMQKGDLCLFYHSNSKPNGVYGMAQVTHKAHPDATQFNKKDPHFEPRATAEKPIWHCVDVGFVEKFKEPVSLDLMKFDPKLEGMLVRTRGRLSVQPVSPTHFRYITHTLAGARTRV